MTADIAFASDDAHRFLPWLVAIMAALAALFLCMALSVSGWAQGRGAVTGGNVFTVSLPAEAKDKAQEVRALLNAVPGVDGIVELGERKLAEMLAPWLGDLQTAANLPLPVVFDVTASSASVDFVALERALHSLVPHAEIDTQARWAAAFSSFSSAVRTAVSTLAFVVIIGMGLMVALASRASLKLHGRSVQLLHSIGAEDGYIARQFQREATMLALPGAAGGAAAAALLYWAAGLYVAALPASSLPSLTMGGNHLLLLIVMPFACAGLAWLVARISIMRQLRRSL